MYKKTHTEKSFILKRVFKRVMNEIKTIQKSMSKTYIREAFFIQKSHLHETLLSLIDQV